MTHEQLEDDIIAKILTFVDADKIEVLPYPNNEAEFRNITTKSRYYIAFEEAEYTKPQSTAETSQVITDKVDIWIISKTRRGETGINVMYDTLTQNLLGYSPLSISKLFGLKYEFYDRGNNVFFYRFTMGMLTRGVENFTPVDGAPISGLEFNFEPPTTQ